MVYVNKGYVICYEIRWRLLNSLFDEVDDRQRIKIYVQCTVYSIQNYWTIQKKLLTLIARSWGDTLPHYHPPLYPIHRKVGFYIESKRKMIIKKVNAGNDSSTPAFIKRKKKKTYKNKKPKMKCSTKASIITSKWFRIIRCIWALFEALQWSIEIRSQGKWLISFLVLLHINIVFPGIKLYMKFSFSDLFFSSPMCMRFFPSSF